MHPLVQDKLPQIAELCRRHHVRRLDLFGSATGEGFDPARSDLDFAVEFTRDATSGLGGDYLSLKLAFEALFKRDVDLVDRSAIRSRHFRDEVNETQVTVYAA